MRRALAEDRAGEDATTHLLGTAARSPATARFISEEEFVVAGVPVVETVFRELDGSAALVDAAPEGGWCRADQTIVTVRSTASALLAGERVALNFLQRLSGIATLTRRAVDAVAGTPAHITHTRKTTPGLRALEQYAVRAGGGVDNRASLADAVLWKDNHWVLLGREGRSLAAALAAAPDGLPVIVEVENEEQLEQALAAGVKHLLIDNQPPGQVSAWARRAGPDVMIQASGGITAETARAYAEAGAGLIAIGALTHSVSAAPIRCDIGATG
ncbi:MAG: carboxylating nicotinate-nucleotide diphosphorylase [Gemmatimonadetes bacterium]|nr:carboxylating nicotinate-nucleotide diphosphorylase [Gemmatimonadota bacterium]